MSRVANEIREAILAKMTPVTKVKKVTAKEPHKEVKVETKLPVKKK